MQFRYELYYGMKSNLKIERENLRKYIEKEGKNLWE